MFGSSIGGSMEDDEQIALFQWAEIAKKANPELEFMYHSPNGGSRHPAEAAKLKRMGVKPGVPDVFLPVPKGVYHGLYIEMKYAKNKTTDKQNNFINFLKSQNYCVEVCYNWHDAAKEVLKYMLITGTGEEK